MTVKFNNSKQVSTFGELRLGDCFVIVNDGLFYDNPKFAVQIKTAMDGDVFAIGLYTGYGQHLDYNTVVNPLNAEVVIR